MELYTFGFTAGKAMVDIYYKQHCIGVTSRAAERLKTLGLRKLVNIRKSQNEVEIEPSVQSFLQK